MFKVGGRVKYKSSKGPHYYVVVEVRSTSVIGEHWYDGTRTELYNEDIANTICKPVLLVTVYGEGWLENATKALKKSRIKYTKINKTRDGEIVCLYVDTKYLDKAKRAYDEYYKGEAI